LITKPFDFDRLASIIDARLVSVERTQLNDREIQVLTLVARGNTFVQIGRRLHMSKRTVDFHISNARIKIGATTRTEAAIKAAAAGLIKP
jgi:DNA-binding CsgD family transcriptional regulator